MLTTNDIFSVLKRQQAVINQDRKQSLYKTYYPQHTNKI